MFEKKVNVSAFLEMMQDPCKVQILNLHLYNLQMLIVTYAGNLHLLKYNVRYNKWI